MIDENDVQTEKNINFFPIFLVFLKMGFTAFGPAFLMQVKKDIVNGAKWINENEFLEGLALAQLIPGASFVSLSIYIGYKLKGLLGAVASFLGFVLPSFFITLLLSWLYFRYQSTVFMNALFKGFGAIVVALILNAVWDLAKITITDIRTILISVTAVILSMFYNNILVILLISAVMGILFLPKSIEEGKKVNLSEKTKIRWRDIIIICAIILFFFMTTAFNKDLLSMAGALFKIGALVFGNAYTMLPLIQHEVVNIHHWLNLDEFMVGLALGQITPGPLSIIATFIGYKVMGFIGSITAAVAIYMPNFLFVVITFGIYGKIKNYSWVKPALKGLLASFVGLMSLVVINTGRHALIDVLTISLCIVAFIMIQFAKWDAKWVIVSGTGIYFLIYEVMTIAKL
jgi:chromate transporter